VELPDHTLTLALSCRDAKYLVMMRSIQRKDVPRYLREGAWYNALDPDDEGAFEVPSDCLKGDQNVTTTDDLYFLLRTIRYWQVEDDPIEVFCFIYLHDKFDIGKEFPMLLCDLEKFNAVKEASPNKRIATALQAKLGPQTVRWLHAHTSCEFSAETCTAAANADDLESLAYLHECGCPWDAETRRGALASGSTACWEYAKAHGCPPLPTDENPVNLAARKGHIDMIKYLRNTGEQWNEQTLNDSLASEGLACTQYLREAGCPWKEDFCMCAALRGRLDCLQYAQEHECPWDFSVLVMSAMRGHLRCLQYAHEQGCPWVDTVTYAAVQGSSLECLKYAHEHGCPWNHGMARLALVNGNWRCLYYAARNGANCNSLALLSFQLVPL